MKWWVRQRRLDADTDEPMFYTLIIQIRFRFGEIKHTLRTCSKDCCK